MLLLALAGSLRPGRQTKLVPSVCQAIAAVVHRRTMTSAQDDGSRGNRSEESTTRPRPRSPIAMAHFDYQLELEARLEEEGTAPDTEAAFEILANHRIREAMRVGDFDELPGKGQPLNRTEDSSDISVKILKNANVLPEWVEVGKVVRERVQGLRASIEPFVKQVVEAQPASLADAMRQLKGVPGWVSAKGGFQVRLDKVNAEIAKHNRMAPNAVMHMMPIKLETEVSALYMKLTNR